MFLQLRTKDLLFMTAAIAVAVALAWVATHHYFYQHVGNTGLLYRTELFSGETALCDPNTGACQAWFIAGVPSLYEWLGYNLAKSVGYYGTLASVLSIPTAFVMWGCIGFLNWFGGLKMTKRTWRVSWGITAMAGLGIAVIAANWPMP